MTINKTYINSKNITLTNMSEKFNVIIEEGQDGYLISEVIELPGCHTQAKTYKELIARTKEAISLFLENNDVKEERIKFVSLEKIEV